LKFEKLAAVDETLPRTEEDLMKNNLTDSFVRAQVPIMEGLLEYFLECNLMEGLAITQSSILMKKHLLMSCIWKGVFERNNDDTITLNKVRMPRNYYRQVWGSSVADKVMNFLDEWGNLLKRDWTLLTLINLYMVFDNEDSFYKDDEQFKTYCKNNLVILRNYMHYYCMKEKKGDILMDLWILYPSIADVRDYVTKELIKFPTVASDRYPYLCEMVNEWWRYSLDEEIAKLSID